MASAGKIKKDPTLEVAVTPVGEWRKSTGPATFVVPLPSGKVVRLKRVQITSLLGENIFPDPMMKIIMDKIQEAEHRPQDHKKSKGEDDVEIGNILKSTEDLNAMMRVMDKLTVFAVVEPPMALHFTERKEGEQTFYIDIPFDERDVEKIYTDEIDENDKMEIFNFVIGGDSNLKTFRGKQPSAVADV